MVQALCQDPNNDVRACMCEQLHYFVEHMGEDATKVLPLLIQLVNDEQSNVRQAAVQTIAQILPLLQPGERSIGLHFASIRFGLYCPVVRVL